MTDTTGSFLNTETNDSASLVVSGKVVRTIPSSHPNFLKIRDYCFEQKRAADQAGAKVEIDMDHVLSLYDTAGYISTQFLRVSDRLTFKDGKLRWEGDPVENTLANHIVRMIKDRDENYAAFAKFMENLYDNPSEQSRQALFDFVQRSPEFTITADGNLLAYKGVTDEYLSTHSGYGVVNGVEFQNAQLSNKPGNVVEIPRSMVNANRNVYCSTGLHVSTRQFAAGFGNRIVTVAVNPRDVVMVPHDSNTKIRVCKYVVLEDNDEELKVTTYKGAHRSDEEDKSQETSTVQCDECGTVLFPDEGSGGLCDECAEAKWGDDDDDDELRDCQCGCND
jgi:hypothetical protein